MAATHQATETTPDAAPLWLPEHDTVVVEQASSRPADVVQGYGAKHRITTVFFGSPWKIASTVSTALAAVLFLSIVPILLGAGLGGLIKLGFYQSWTWGVMLIVTARVRSVSIATAARYWLAGLFTVAIAAYFLNGPLEGLADPSRVWITPPLEELLKAAPLAIAVIMGHRVWRHPGLSDLMLLGFAVGAGYAMHEDALWERAAVSGFEANAGVFVPTIFQPDGVFVVGHAVWTALIGLAIGLFLLHRHQAPAVVAGAFVALVVVGDHMAINDPNGTLDWVRQMTFNSKLIAVLFLVGLGAAVLLDRRRLAATAARDHLFPSDRSHGTRPVEGTEDDLLMPLFAGRYRRLRNGMHNTIDATAQQWPPRCEARSAPVAELARLARAADVAVGPGTSSYGWAPDPGNPTGMRFVGPEGFTAYGSSEDVAVAPVEADVQDTSAPEDDATTNTTISSPKARRQAAGAASIERGADYWQYFGVAMVAVALFVLLRMLTAGDASPADVDVAFSLPYAPNSPALIRGLLGAAAAAVAIRGRNAAVLGAGSEVGPGDDPTPDRPEECEA